MAGISDVGLYVPSYRLKRDELARAWGRKPSAGEKAVANHDEDSITLAVEACLDALEGAGPSSVQGLYFASTTSPYRQKQAASVIAAACDLPARIDAVDVAGSSRAGASALRLALHSIEAGSAESLLVVAADKRTAEPESSQETTFGDGAAAFVVSKTAVAVEVARAVAWADDFLDEWRKEDDAFVSGDDSRFAQTYGAGRVLKQALRELGRSGSFNPAEFDGVILPAANAKAAQGLAKSLGFDPARQLVADPLPDRVGLTGVPHPMLQLAATLARSKPGQNYLLVAYGDGCEVFHFRTTERVRDLQKKLDPERWLGVRRDLKNYEEYLKVKGLLGAPAPSPNVTNVLAFKDQPQNIRLHASKCRKCGFVQFPTARVCQGCRSKDEMDSVRLSRKGTVFTLTKDNLYEAPVSPLLMGVIDLEGGGRLYTQVTDCDPERYEIGMPVELTLRWYHDGGGFRNYFWKARPVRSR